MSTVVSDAIRRQVAERAQGCCEYCRIPQGMSGFQHEPDHIIPQQHGGETVLDNLALACFRCNRYKGPNLGSLDPETGALMLFFNPRLQIWAEHFQLDGAVIRPLTAEGRVTVKILRLNATERVEERQQLQLVGLYPTV